MGISKTAAVVAALLAVVLIAISLPADSTSASGRAESPSDEPGIHSIQTRSTLRGQAWATELFGRRYGRNLLAAVAPDSGSGEIGA
jgi:hypothetical protein